MIVADRIKEYADSVGVSLRQIETSIGASNGLISGAIKRRTDIGSKWVSAIIDKWPTINPDWLLIGRGNMYRDSEDYVLDSITPLRNLKTPERKIEHQTIPFYNIAARAGFLSQILDVRQNPDDYIYIPDMPRCDGAIFVSGDSMYPILKAGDTIAFALINDTSHIMWGQMYIVDFSINGDDYLSVKWVNRSDKGEDYIKLVSQNEHHAPIDIPRSSIRKMAIIKLSFRRHTQI